MTSSNEKSGKGIIILLLLLIVGLLVAVLASSRSHTQPATNTSAATPSTSTALQGCMNQAHQQWDGAIASAEGTPGNAYSFDKSQLDQRLVQCHQQYGY
jgi:hypothetical protein